MRVVTNASSRFDCVDARRKIPLTSWCSALWLMEKEGEGGRERLQCDCADADLTHASMAIRESDMPCCINIRTELTKPPAERKLLGSELPTSMKCSTGEGKNNAKIFVTGCVSSIGHSRRTCFRHHLESMDQIFLRER